MSGSVPVDMVDRLIQTGDEYIYVIYNDDNKFVNYSDWASYVEIDISTDTSLEIDFVDENAEPVVIAGKNVYFDETDEITAKYIDEDGFYTSVFGTVSKETIIQIIENMN